MNTIRIWPPGLVGRLHAGIGAEPGRELRLRRAMRHPHAFATMLATLVALAALVPLGFVAWVAVDTGWETASTLIFRGRVLELLVNTALLELCTIPLTLVVATTIAWVTERTDLPGARLWSWLAVAPLAVPAFVHSYAWITVVPGLSGLPAGVLISSLAYFPFVYLPVAAQLRQLDPALEDAAASLGRAPWQVLLEIVLPQLRLAMCGGALLVGLHLLSEYGLFVMIRFDTFTTAIVDQFQSTFNGPAANMLAGVLVLVCLVFMGGEVLIRGDARYARVGLGSPAPAPARSLGIWTIPCLVFLAVIAALSVGVPLVTLSRWLLAGGFDVWRADPLVQALGTTVVYALAGGIVATLAAMPMAWLSVRAPSRLRRLLEACHYYVGSLPGVVVALALVTITVRVALPLYQTVVTVIAAYVLMFLPRALIGLRASLAQTPPELERAATALGRTPLQAVLKVTLRLSAPGAAASVALVALGITTELTATLMLAPTGATTLATKFWSLTGEIDYAAAAPYALLMILFSLPLTLLLHWQSRKVAGR